MRMFIAAIMIMAPIGAARAQITDLSDQPGGPPDSGVERQLKGEFPAAPNQPRTPSGAVQGAWSEAAPTDGILRTDYKPDQITHVALRERMTTTISIPTWDSIDEWVLSDNHHFEARAGKQKHTLHVWPKVPGADASLIIIGESRNAYVFRLVGYTWNSRQLPNLLVSLAAPEPRISSGDGAAGTTDEAKAAAQGEDWPIEVGFDPTKLRKDLEMRGDEELAPQWVYRDDYRTYLDFGDSADSKEGVGIWRVVDGYDQPVNFSLSKDRRVITVYWAGPITLRKGERVVCIRPVPQKTARRSR